ncbi:immunoglobulin-like domain-containing protein [Bacteroidota bacterium]
MKKVLASLLMTGLLFALSFQVKSQTYCTVSFTNNNSYNMGMQEVNIGTISNYTTTTYTSPYNYYSSMTTTHYPGQTVNVNIKVGSGNNTWCTIYIDYNNDGTFNTTNERVYSSGLIAASAYTTGSFTIPASAPAGIKRMRVFGDYGSLGVSGPCTGTYTGEAEDYNIKILSLSGFDCALTRIDSPKVFSVDSNKLTVTFSNLKADSIRWLDLGYSFNGGTPIQIFDYNKANGSHFSPIGPGESHQYTFDKSIFVPAKGSYSLKVWVGDVNDSIPDNNPNNDTLFWNFCTGMGGNYTIGPNKDYTTFSAAVAALQSCGVAGPIVFTIDPGTYNEKVTLPDNITGMDANSTVTFDGLDKSKVALTYGINSSANRATLLFNGADYFTFKNMTIVNSSANYGVAAMFMNEADYNTIVDCKLEVNQSYNSSYAVPIQFTSSEGTPTGSGNNGNYNTFENCDVIGGYYGVQIYGVSTTTGIVGNKVIGCNITGQYYAGIYSYYVRETTYKNNTIDVGSRYTSCYGIYEYYSSKNIIDGNHIMPGQYGIYTGYENYTAGFQSDSTLIINNLIHGFKNATYQCGYYGYYNNYNLRVLCNTIHVAGTYANNYSYAAIYLYYPRDPIIMNNILISDGNTMLLSLYPYAYNATVDYNDYMYGSTTNYMFYNNSTYHSDLDDWKTSTYNLTIPHDENSWENEDPKFSTTNPYHLNPDYPPLTGKTFGYVDSDVDGDPRCIYRSVLGADESDYTTGLPVSKFFSEDTICYGSPVTFLNMSSPTASQGYWWYRNNKFATKEFNYTRTFALGKYYDTISLITANCAGKDTFTKVVLIDAPTSPPVADFMAEINDIETAFPIQFNDLTQNCPSGWFWKVSPATVTIPGIGTQPSYSFLPPTSAFAQDPIILFEYPGVYKVCLTAYNTVGADSICKEKYIVVRPSQWICGTVLPAVSASMRGILFDENGPVNDYGNGTNCEIMLNPCADKIDFSFTEFTVAAGDYFRIFEGTDNSGTPLWNVNTYGTNGVNGDLSDPGFQSKFTSNSGSLFIEWVTNASTVAAGFVGEWNASPGSFTPPTALFDGPDTVCLMAPVAFDNMSTSDGGSYSWDFDNDGFFDSFEEDGEYLFPFTGMQQVKLVVEDCGGTSTYIKNVMVIQPPQGPNTQFMADILRPVAGKDIVTFTDLTTGCVNSWTWSISPTTFTIISDYPNGQSPQVQFNDTGYYDVTLTAAFGTYDNPLVKSMYIKAIQYCAPDVTNLSPDVGIGYVEIAELNNTPILTNSTPIGKEAFTDYSGTVSAYLDIEASYIIKLERSTTYNAMERKAWIDWNMNGEYETSEEIGSESNASTLSWSDTFSVPSTASLGATRMRVATALGGQTNDPCNTRLFGEVEEYRVIIRPDGTPPVITLKGLDTVYVSQCGSYVDSAATAWDNIDGVITSNIVTTNNLDLQNYGEYWYKYVVSDAEGNKTTSYRVIFVEREMDAPVFVLVGSSNIYVEVNNSYIEPGFSASDACSGMDTVEVISDVNTAKLGTYMISYTAYDKNANMVKLTRTVVVGDTTDPDVTLAGSTPIYLPVHDGFTDPGLTILDNYCTLSEMVILVSGSVDEHKLGTYTLTYDVSDCNGNGPITLVREVIVYDSVAPEIMTSLNDGDTITMEVMENILNILPAMAFMDNYYEAKDLSMIPGGDYYTNFPTGVADKLGFYIASLTVMDGSMNSSMISFVINVVDTEAPVITNNGKDYLEICRFDKVDPADIDVTVKDNFDNGVTLVESGTYKEIYLNTYMEGFYSMRFNAKDGSNNAATQVNIYVNVMDCPSSIAENDLANSVSLYPNPTNKEFFLDVNLNSTERLNVTLLNALGETVMLIADEYVQSNSFKVDLQGLSSGVYFVQLKTSGNVAIKRVVLTK